MYKEMKRLFSYNLVRPQSCLYCTYAHSNRPANPTIEPVPLRHFDLIKEFTGGSTKKAQKVLTKYLDLQLLDGRTLHSRINVLKDINLTDKNSLRIIPFLIKHPGRLKNRYKSLCEFGICQQEISTGLINKFISLCKFPVWKLKEMNLIEKEFDVMLNLWKAADLSLDFCPKIGDDASLYSMKAAAIKAFLREKLEYTEEMLAEIEGLLIFRLQNKSFDTINKNYHIFKDIIRLSKKRIRKNWYVLFGDPDNVMEILNRIKKIGGIDVKDCLHIYPKISVMTAENMEKMEQYVKDAGIPVTYFQHCIKILTLSCETVNQRLHELKRIDFFLFNIHHPRILELVHYQVKAKKRLKILEKLKLQANVWKLSGSEKEFERFCLFGGRPSGMESLYYLYSELDMDKNELRKKLRRHPRWTYVPVVHVGKNLQMLRQSFSDDDIKKNIYILFYYNEKLSMELENLESREGLEFFKENGVVKKEYILPLTLYFLEKGSNFTGDSVWNIDENPYQDMPDPSELLSSTS